MNRNWSDEEPVGVDLRLTHWLGENLNAWGLALRQALLVVGVGFDDGC